jgi:hypothetical protein
MKKENAAGNIAERVQEASVVVEDFEKHRYDWMSDKDNWEGEPPFELSDPDEHVERESTVLRCLEIAQDTFKLEERIKRKRKILEELTKDILEEQIVAEAHLHAFIVDGPESHQKALELDELVEEFNNTLVRNQEKLIDQVIEESKEALKRTKSLTNQLKEVREERDPSPGIPSDEDDKIAHILWRNRVEREGKVLDFTWEKRSKLEKSLKDKKVDPLSIVLEEYIQEQ